MAKTQDRPYINPRFRAYGRARIDIAQRAQTRQDWDRMWKQPQNPFAFEWGEPWKQCIEYRVDDFAAEVGFLIDILGLPVRAFSPEFAMFTSPDEAFNFAVVPTPPGADSTPPGAFRLQFMLAELFETCEDLTQRGVIFDQQAQPVGPGAHLWIAAFHTPHGIPIELWGMVEQTEDFSEKEDDSTGLEADLEQFEDPEPDADEMEAAFQAARRRVASERPELAISTYAADEALEDDEDEGEFEEEEEGTPVFKSPPPRPSMPREDRPASQPRVHKTAEELLASLSRKPVTPAPKPSPAREDSGGPVHSFEPTYEPVDDEEAESEPQARRFPQEYHYRPIRLDEKPEPGQEK